MPTLGGKALKVAFAPCKGGVFSEHAFRPARPPRPAPAAAPDPIPRPKTYPHRSRTLRATLPMTSLRGSHDAPPRRPMEIGSEIVCFYTAEPASGRSGTLYHFLSLRDCEVALLGVSNAPKMTF
eukprot:scaffold88739_cov78-Phaeocystis_antarctica.AAC.1